MIEIKHITKSFDGCKAVEDVSVTIKEGQVFGLIGTNGAGKSTTLRIMTGIMKPDAGEALVDEEPVYRNVGRKERITFIPDEPYFFSSATPVTMAQYYASIYPAFEMAQFYEWLDKFGLEKTRRIATFSKGMKKQLIMLLSICTHTKYLICDETFDGLDPVMRQTVKSLFANDIEERNLTPVIASHNLRELEDICDHVGLLHKGGMLLSKDLDDMKLNIHKIQCVLPAGVGSSDLQGIDIIKTEQRGSLLTLTVRGKREEIQTILQAYHPVFFEMIPLSLEEIFISETEVAGYDIKRLVF